MRDRREDQGQADVAGVPGAVPNGVLRPARAVPIVPRRLARPGTVAPLPTVRWLDSPPAHHGHPAPRPEAPPRRWPQRLALTAYAVLGLGPWLLVLYLLMFR